MMLKWCCKVIIVEEMPASAERRSHSPPSHMLHHRSATRRRITSMNGILPNDVTKSEKRQHPDHPCHSHKESLFSTSSGYNNYRGFLNLCILLLLISNARLVIENILKYGILVDPFQWVSVFLVEPYNWPCASLLCFSNVFVLIAFAVEKKLAAGKIDDGFGRWLHIMNCGLLLLIPAIAIYRTEPNPFCSVWTLAFYSIIFLKLISYAQVNKWCRHSQMKKEKSELMQAVVYPNNLTLGNMYYFIFAPTLCYELNYPRTQRIRKWFLAKRIGEILFLGQLTLGLSQQWILPLLRNSLEPFVNVSLLCYANWIPVLLFSF